MRHYYFQKDTACTKQKPTHSFEQILRFMSFFTNLNLPIQCALIGGLGIGLGAMITSIISLYNSHLSRRHEERTQIRNIAVQLAVEQWKRKESTKGDVGWLPNVLETMLDTTNQLLFRRKRTSRRKSLRSQEEA